MIYYHAEHLLTPKQDKEKKKLTQKIRQKEERIQKLKQEVEQLKISISEI